MTALVFGENQPAGANQRHRQQRKHLRQQADPRPRGFRRLALDVIIDGPDTQAAQQKPARIGPVMRHGLGNDGFRGPVEFHAGLATAQEEIGIAAAEEIEAQIEGGIRKPGKHRPRDQAVAGTIDHRHRPARVVGRPERRMALQARASSRHRNSAAPVRRPDRRRWSRRRAPSAPASPPRQSRRRRSSGNGPRPESSPARSRRRR